MKKIWIVEDDSQIAGLLSEHLSRYGFETAVSQDFSRLDEEFQRVKPHLVLMDVNLPKYDGFFWCKKLRRLTKHPIVFVSARNQDFDQIYAMECGGDDYITKPFSFEVITAKINAQLRRCFGEYAEEKETDLECGDCRLSTVKLKLSCHESQAALSKNETDILKNLFQAYPGYVKREVLLKSLWDEEMFVEENTLTVNITRARRRLKEVGSRMQIKAVRGVGYLLEEEDG